MGKKTHVPTWDTPPAGRNVGATLVYDDTPDFRRPMINGSLSLPMRGECPAGAVSVELAWRRAGEYATKQPQICHPPAVIRSPSWCCAGRVSTGDTPSTSLSASATLNGRRRKRPNFLRPVITASPNVAVARARVSQRGDTPLARQSVART